MNRVVEDAKTDRVYALSYCNNIVCANAINGLIIPLRRVDNVFAMAFSSLM